MVKEISGRADLERAVSSKPVVVVDFFATWCAPCKKMAPVLEDWEAGMADNGDAWLVAVRKVDVDAHAALAREFGVRSMPTFVVFVHGEPRFTVVGADRRLLRQRVESAMQTAYDARAHARQRAQRSRAPRA